VTYCRPGDYCPGGVFKGIGNTGYGALRQSCTTATTALYSNADASASSACSSIAAGKYGAAGSAGTSCPTGTPYSLAGSDASGDCSEIVPPGFYASVSGTPATTVTIGVCPVREREGEGEGERGGEGSTRGRDGIKRRRRTGLDAVTSRHAPLEKRR
jgi:hypothetical protein